MLEEAKDVLGLPAELRDLIQKSKEQFTIVALLFKTFEKAKLEPVKLRSFAWTVFILARGASGRARCAPLVG